MCAAVPVAGACRQFTERLILPHELTSLGYKGEWGSLPAVTSLYTSFAIETRMRKQVPVYCKLHLLLQKLNARDSILSLSK